MSENYVAPEFRKKAFNCPYCSAYAHQNWLPFKTFADWIKLQQEMTSEASMNLSPFVSEREKRLSISRIGEYFANFIDLNRSVNELTTSYCSHCGKYSYWHDGKLIYPAASSAPMPSDDMPEDCKKLYNEAREISDKSARGAGALIRLCLEKLLIELGGKESNNINNNIALLLAEDTINERVQRAADLCRVKGNAFAHPSAINMEDSGEIILRLFKLVNLIVENAITEPKELEADFGSLSDSKKEEIAKRNERAIEKVVHKS